MCFFFFKEFVDEHKQLGIKLSKESRVNAKAKSKVMQRRKLQAAMKTDK